MYYTFGLRDPTILGLNTSSIKPYVDILDFNKQLATIVKFLVMRLCLSKTSKYELQLWHDIHIYNVLQNFYDTLPRAIDVR